MGNHSEPWGKAYPAGIDLMHLAILQTSAFHRGKRWDEITLRRLVDEYAGDPTACLAFMTPEGGATTCRPTW